MPPKAKPKSKTKISKKPIPEDFELSSDEEEPKTVSLNKEQKLTSKFITFNCPMCHHALQIKNEIEINPKGVRCSCNPCSFKISKNDKTMNISKDDEGGITLDTELHSISFSWNKQITPPCEDDKQRKIISEVMTPRRNTKKQVRIEDLDWENDLKSRFLGWKYINKYLIK